MTSTSVNFGDVNGDGAPDLFLAVNGKNELWMNDGFGSFTAATGGPTAGSVRSHTAAFGDLNGDGMLDLFVGNYFGVNELWTYGCADGVRTLTGGCATCSPFAELQGGKRCVECSAHSARDATGECTSCQPGYERNLAYAQCTACLPGTSWAEGSACTECAVGQYADTNRTVVCKVCPSFSTTSATGSTSVDACECVKNYYEATSDGGSKICAACPEGSSTASNGATSVNQCVCDAGRFFKIDASGAATCPQCKDEIPNSASILKGATSFDACDCIPGFYQSIVNGTQTCVACDPILMDCSIPGITLANMPIKRGGWRLSNTTSTVYECFNPDACAGNPGAAGSNATQRRRLSAGASTSTAGDNLCSLGHTGFLCGACVANWCGAPHACPPVSLPSNRGWRGPLFTSHMLRFLHEHDNRYGYKDGQLCSECAGNTGLAFVPGAVLLVAVIISIIIFCRGGGEVVSMETALDSGLTAALEEKALEKRDEATAEAMDAVESRAKAAPNAECDIKHRVAKLVSRAAKFSVKFKILVSLWQVLQGIGAAFSIPFPTFYEQAVSAVSGVIQIELPAVMPLDCIIATSYYSKLAFKCIWPLIAYAVLGILSKVLLKCGKADQADSCINFGFLIMFVIYPSVSSGWVACPLAGLLALPAPLVMLASDMLPL